MDGINIQLPWNSSESPLEYNYGSYGMGGAGSLSLDVSPTELKSMSVGGYSGNYSTVGGQFTSVSPAPSNSWYSPSDGNVHILHTGEILRKVDPGLCVTSKFRLFDTAENCLIRISLISSPIDIRHSLTFNPSREMPMISSVLSHQGNRKNKRYTARNNIPKFCWLFLGRLLFLSIRKNIRETYSTHTQTRVIYSPYYTGYTHTRRKRKPLGFKRGKKRRNDDEEMGGVFSLLLLFPSPPFGGPSFSDLLTICMWESVLLLPPPPPPPPPP
jgi:hypothetical protein